jgi:hypothetical protein
MRGSPVLRAIVVVIVMLLAGIPLWRLTHTVAAPMEETPSAPKASSSVSLELTFAHPPSDFQILHLGKVIWEGKEPGETAHQTVAMEFPKEGIDLEIKANWPAGTPLTAVRLTVTRGDDNPIEKTVWGQGNLDEVLTFGGSQ